jgi:hypothetical protein
MSVQITHVADINTVSQTFEAHFVLDAVWEDPEVQTMDTPRDWSGIWDPRLEIANISDYSRVTIHEDRRKLRTGERGVWIHLRWEIFGVFTEALEMRSFPLDEQDLHLNFVSLQPMSQIILINSPFTPSQLLMKEHPAEWAFEAEVECTGAITTKPGETVAGRERPMWIFEMKCSRNYGFYVFNVVIPVISLALLALTAYFVRTTTHTPLANKLSVSLSVLLMLVGFKFSTLKHLPILSYMTMIDKFGMMGIICAALVVASNVVHVLLSKAGIHWGIFPFVGLNLLFILCRGGYLAYQCREYLKSRTSQQLFQYPVDTMVQFKYKQDGSGVIHPEFLEHNQGGLYVRHPELELFEGTRVFHASRGNGTVMEIDMKDERGKPWRIVFDNGEEHHYSEHSLTSGKFFLHEDTDEKDDDHSQEPVPELKFGGNLAKRRSMTINL